jgi:hypothetical protein
MDFGERSRGRRIGLKIWRLALDQPHPDVFCVDKLELVQDMVLYTHAH